MISVSAYIGGNRFFCLTPSKLVKTTTIQIQRQQKSSEGKWKKIRIQNCYNILPKMSIFSKKKKSQDMQKKKNTRKYDTYSEEGWGVSRNCLWESQMLDLADKVSKAVVNTLKELLYIMCSKKEIIFTELKKKYNFSTNRNY